MAAAFRGNLERYVNGGCFSRTDALLSLAGESLPFRRNAQVILREYGEGRSCRPTEGPEGEELALPFYDGDNPFVKKMISFLEENLRGELAGAYVLGSIGTGEEVAYSDFDAVAIVRGEVFASPARLAAAAVKLNRAYGIMLECDPLQHHGWFVMTERDLDCYPEHYLPLVVLRRGRSMLRGGRLRVTAREAGGEDGAKEALARMCAGVGSALREGAWPTGMYPLKSLLSRFMLLPALYVQVRDGEGIFKKESFAAAKGDFSQGAWSAMDEVSSIRLEWVQEVSAGTRRLLGTPCAFARMRARRIATPVPEEIAARLTQDLRERMLALADEMCGRERWE